MPLAGGGGAVGQVQRLPTQPPTHNASGLGRVGSVPATAWSELGSLVVLVSNPLFRNLVTSERVVPVLTQSGSI